MLKPLLITFHDMPPSAWVESAVRSGFEALLGATSDVVACHADIRGQDRIAIGLSLPGGELNVLAPLRKRASPAALVRAVSASFARPRRALQRRR